MALETGRLEARIESRMRAAGVPGVAIGIVGVHGTVYARGFGTTRAGGAGGDPITPATCFRIASVTKPLTGTMLIRLVERHLLDLDAPLTAYLPDLHMSVPGAEENISLRSLLSHTSGLPLQHDYCAPLGHGSLEEFVRVHLAGVPLVVPPGAFWSYSNPGFSVAGHLAEVVTGKSYVELMRELVFDPLEMRATTFDPARAPMHSLAMPHTVGANGQTEPLAETIDNPAGYPYGFAYSTVDDLARFAAMYLGMGLVRGERLIGPIYLDSMETPQVNLYTANEKAWGLGWSIERYKGVRVIGHSGAITGYRSRIDLAPDDDLAVLVLCNSDAPTFDLESIAREVIDDVLELRAPTPRTRLAVRPETGLLDGLTGTYRGYVTGLASLALDGDDLVLDLNGERTALAYQGERVFVGERGQSGQTVTVGIPSEVAEAGPFIIVDGSPCERVPTERLGPPPPDVPGRIAGEYTGEDDITVRVENGAVMLRSRAFGTEWRLVYAGDGLFACPIGLFEFRLPEAGPADALVLARSLTFRRVGRDSGS